MSTKSKPRILLTMGDPGGVGLEVIAKALKHFGSDWPFTPILVASKQVFEHPFHQDQFSGIPSDSLGKEPLKTGVLYTEFVDDSEFTIGDHAQGNGLLAFRCLQRAVALIADGRADTLCTAPLSKAALHMAGLPYTGHTSCLAELTGADHVSMAFSCPELRVLLHSIHIPLSAVPGTVVAPKLELSFKHAFDFAKICGISNPRVGVAALNPHAGERGKLGFEDSEIIAPLVKRFQEEGQRISGPYPADTIFWDAKNGAHDVVVAMYHDQALIPIKTLAFDLAVNVTVGLPFLRTSPDHGTAFDIAYKGVASPSSIIEAIRFAVEHA